MNFRVVDFTLLLQLFRLFRAIFAADILTPAIKIAEIDFYGVPNCHSWALPPIEKHSPLSGPSHRTTSRSWHIWLNFAERLPSSMKNFNMIGSFQHLSKEVDRSRRITRYKSISLMKALLRQDSREFSETNPKNQPYMCVRRSGEVIWRPQARETVLNALSVSIRFP